MEVVEGYDHRTGVHCGAAALRNVSRYYGWNYSEAACFGIGGGPAFVRYDHPDEPWMRIRTTPTWLERAFFERLGIPHMVGADEDFETAWAETTARIDGDDPVLLFLDPDRLPYLSDDVHHLPPHVAVMIGYDDETVTLADGALESRQEVTQATLRDAWRHDRYLPLTNEYLIVTRGVRSVEGNDAAAAGLREIGEYMLDPLHVKRDARGPDEEGIAALRAFAESLGSWADWDDPKPPVADALVGIDEHGDGSAFRGLFAETLEELGQRTGLAPTVAGKMASIAREWRTVRDRLAEILDADDPRPATFGEAASVVGDIADREADLYEVILDELGGPRR